MSEAEPCLKQSYNSRSKKWVLIDCAAKGGIKDMQPEKYEGIPVIKAPGNNEHSNTQTQSAADNEQETKQQQPPEQQPEETETGHKNPDNNEDRKRRRFLF